MKKRRILSSILIIFFFASLILCGTVMAYMFQQTQYEDNLFTTAYVSCMVEEEFDGVKKTRIQVQNTGNIPAYVRVRLVTYWVKEVEEGKAEITGRASEMPEIAPATGWVPGANYTYYYSMPVEPKAFTTEFLSEPIELEEDGDYLQVVEVFAEAIQSIPLDAMQESWGVTVTDGKITEITN